MLWHINVNVVQELELLFAQDVVETENLTVKILVIIAKDRVQSLVQLATGKVL